MVSALDLLGYAAAAVYCVSMLLLAVYGINHLSLFLRALGRWGWLRRQEEQEAATPLPPDDQLPRVLVQLPVFNERDVVEAALEAMGQLDWPHDRLEIQLLDDSTDDSVEIGRQAVERLRARGIDAVSLHRTDRKGYKAGALQAGMARSQAEFIAIFDADFTPEPDFIRKAIRPFLAEPRLAVVQGRWEHRNREQNLLTRCQALGLDSHFGIDQVVRGNSDLTMHFNGTCGMWRRAAIDDAGGWSADTLTEDLDLSYRVQLRGWRLTYRPSLAVAGELPTDIHALRQQQFRWAKGSQQATRKLLRRVWLSGWPLHRRLSAALHLGYYAAHPLMFINMLSGPLAAWLCPKPPLWALILGMFAFFIGALSPIASCVGGQFLLRGRKAWSNLRHLPTLLSLGTGVVVSNSIAVIEAWRGMITEFVRTPKQGTGSGSYKAAAATGLPELLFGVWACIGVAMSLSTGRPWIAPLLITYSSGLVLVGAFCFWQWLRRQQWQAAQERVAARLELVPTAALAAIGGLLLAGYLVLGLHGRGAWWWDPVLPATIGIAAGLGFLAAAWLVRHRPRGLAVATVVIVFGLAFRLVSLAGPPSDELGRAVIEGRQLAVNQNPYRIAPSDPAAQHTAGPAAGMAAALSAPDVPSRTGPVALASQMLVARLHPDVGTMRLAHLLYELLALGLVAAILIIRRWPVSVLLLALWNPIGPLWFAGQGHGDALLLALLALGLWLAEKGKTGRSILSLSLATLVRPTAAVTLLPTLADRPWRVWILPALCTGLALLPALMLLPTWLGGSAPAEGPTHGVLHPLVTAFLGRLLSNDLVPAVAFAILLALGLTGGWLLLRAEQRQVPALRDHLTLAARLSALVLVCLPSLQPWHFAPLALLLPFASSWGLTAWVALVPIWYLHGGAILDARTIVPGAWAEAPWAITLAHLPPLALVGWELFQSRRLELEERLETAV